MLYILNPRQAFSTIWNSLLCSRNIRGVARYKEDILHGLGGGDCDERYRVDCPQSIWQLLTITKPVLQLLKQQRRHRFQSPPWSDRFFNFD